MPILELLWVCTNFTTRSQAATCSGEYMPAQWRLMRPSGSTSVISVSTRPAPPMARLPSCTRWKSFTVPSLAEYMHIGDSAMRLGKTSSRKR